MTTTPVLTEDDVAPDPVPLSGSFVEPLVARLHEQYGIAPGRIRDLAVELLAGFAGAPVQAFVPVLVEKRLREFCRNRA